MVASSTAGREQPAEPEMEIRINMDRLQREAAQAREGPVAIIGGPGAGKSHTLCARVIALIQGGRPPVTITILTFSSRAASNIRYQINEMTSNSELNRHLYTGTFHQFASTFLRQAGAARLGISPHYTMWDHDQAREVIAGLAAADPSLEISQDEIKRILQWGGLNKSRRLEALEAPEREEWVRINELYNREKQLQSTLDLDDLIPMAVRALEENPDLRIAWSSVRTRHMLIDEFQDITPMQYRMMELLQGKTRSITIATDPNQAIHAWRGAMPRLLNQFRADHADLEVHLLRLNHRQTKTLAENATALTNHEAMSGLSDSYQTAIRPVGAEPELLDFEGGLPEQHRRVLEIAWELKREIGLAWEDMAVIYRRSRTVEGLYTHLMQQAVPYTVLGEATLGDQEEAKQVIALLSLLSNPVDHSAFMDAATTEAKAGRKGLNREIGRQIKESSERERINLIEAAERYAPMVRPVVKQRVNLDFIVRAWKELNLEIQLPGVNPAKLVEKAGDIVARNRIDQRREVQSREVIRLTSLAERFRRRNEERPREHLARFLESVKVAPYPDHRSEENGNPYAHNQGMTLSTIHASKGMQWKAVWIADASDYAMPGRAGMEEGSPAYEEEQRIFYTASTRATDYLFYCNARRGRQGFVSEPSRFLECTGGRLKRTSIGGLR